MILTRKCSQNFLNQLSQNFQFHIRQNFTQVYYYYPQYQYDYLKCKKSLAINCFMEILKIFNFLQKKMFKNTFCGHGSEGFSESHFLVVYPHRGSRRVLSLIMLKRHFGGGLSVNFYLSILFWFFFANLGQVFLLRSKLKLWNL